MVLLHSSTGVSVNRTWYVRPDGGTRYSANATAGQCDGLGDAAYSGSGVNQHCAFNDVRNLWTDGTYTTNPNAGAPAWGWIGAGGDTYIIRGSLSTGVSYRVGQTGPNANQYMGLAGDPYSAGAPAPISGTPGAHTRILGENYANCSAASAKTQLHGGYGVYAVLNMQGTSYVDVQCLDITDFSACGRSGQVHGCNTNYPLDDYATNGVMWNNTSTNDTLTDVHVHGISAGGMIGPTGDGVVLTRVDLIGNAGAGWNADAGDGTTGTGTLQVRNFNISWNGCTEEYPIIDSLPYNDCTDDNMGGYGDGFGTATVQSNPAWHVTFDQGVVSYNTQDGLDALHLTGSGSSMTISRTLAYGNMGQQIKVGGAAGTAVNNVIVTNCNALRQSIPGTPAGYNTRLSDFCRAADTGVALSVGPNSTLTFDFNTIYSASATGVEVDCDNTNGPCGATSLVDYRDNTFIGFMNNSADGYPSGGSGDYSNPIYDGTGVWPFGNAGSVFSNNITFHPKSNWTCPAHGETNSLCIDPLLSDETWHLYGPNDAQPTASSPVLGQGVSLPSVTTDYLGQTRANPPSIGAYER